MIFLDSDNHPFKAEEYNIYIVPENSLILFMSDGFYSYDIKDNVCIGYMDTGMDFCVSCFKKKYLSIKDDLYDLSGSR